MLPGTSFKSDKFKSDEFKFKSDEINTYLHLAVGGFVTYRGRPS